MKRMTLRKELIGFVGETNEIKALYNSVYRAYMKGRFDNIYPSYFCGEDGLPAKYSFSKKKAYYMLSFNEDGIVTVHDSDVIAAFVVDGAKIA